MIKNRLHLDVRVGVALGAVRVRLLRADGVDESTLAMQVGEGNEFCLD